MARLASICYMNMGQSPDSASYNENGEGIPFFQGNADFGEVNPKVRVWCNAPQKIAHEGDILISVRAPIGALNIADTTCCIGRGLAALTINESVCEKKYLWYAIASKVDELNAKGTGSTFKAISKIILAELEIPLPPKIKQQEIAVILDKITDLISLRKQQIAKLDELVRARFVEMFGDPVSNPRGWNMEPLGDRCEIITGNTPPRADADNFGAYIEWIKSDNISTNNFSLSRAVEYLSKKGFSKCRYVESENLLMTCIAGSLNSIGNVAITDRRVSFNQQINAIIPKNNNVLFMYWMLTISKTKIHGSVNMMLKGILSKGQLSEIPFIFPPIEIQNQFAVLAGQVKKSKVEFRKSLEELVTLKKALMQQYFG